MAQRKRKGDPNANRSGAGLQGRQFGQPALPPQGGTPVTPHVPQHQSLSPRPQRPSTPQGPRAQQGFRKVLNMPPSTQEQLEAEYKRLQQELFALRKIKAVIAVLNSKSSGKTTVSSWATAVLKHFTGLPWLLVDCNENAGGPIRRIGLKVEDTQTVQELIEYVKNGGSISHEYAVEHFGQHWQPSLGGSYGEGFLALACDPAARQPIAARDLQELIGMLKMHFAGIVEDTGNGPHTPANNGAFGICNSAIFTGRADDDESLVHLGLTLEHYREMDPGKVANSMLVINATEKQDQIGKFAERFHFPAERILFVPASRYLANGRDSRNGNIVRLDMLSQLELISFMRIGKMALCNAHEVMKAFSRQLPPLPQLNSPQWALHVPSSAP